MTLLNKDQSRRTEDQSGYLPDVSVVLLCGKDQRVSDYSV
jgi:hypothetical protein